jgi:glycosyltransferase involved in cell wall biosynthesis
MKQSFQPLFMSVVVCAYNSERVIARAIESLLAQDYPREQFEIVVVDDGSSDRTSAIVRGYPVRLVRHVTNLGLAAARNTGLSHIKGDVYVSFDDDCVVDPDWLCQLALGYGHDNVAGVGSSIEDPVEVRGIATRFMAAAGSANPPSMRLGASRSPLLRFAAYFSDQLKNDQPDTNVYQVRALNGATATFLADVLHAVGGWDASLRAAEDNDICTRIVKKFPNLNFFTVATARVVHDPRMGLRRFLCRPYSRGADTLKYYRRNSLTPPVFPFPCCWLSLTVVSGLMSPVLGLIAAILLPQLMYIWWPMRAVMERNLWHLLHAYLQLAEESSTLAGLVRGHVVLWRRPDRTQRGTDLSGSPAPACSGPDSSVLGPLVAGPLVAGPSVADAVNSVADASTPR